MKHGLVGCPPSREVTMKDKKLKNIKEKSRSK